MSSCPPEGNHGLPIIIEGAITNEQLESKKADPIIELQASARTTYPTVDDKLTFNESSMTTMRIKGRNYTLSWAHIIRPTNYTDYALTGLHIGQILAEFVLWFQSPSDKSVYVTFVPILQGASLNNGGAYINAALTKDSTYRGSIGDILEQRSIHYQTCIEYTNNGATKDIESTSEDLLSLKVNVLLFLDGIIIGPSTYSSLIQKFPTFPEFSIPVSLFSGESNKVKTAVLTSNNRRLFKLDQLDGSMRKTYAVYTSVKDFIDKNKLIYYPITFITTTENARKAKTASAFKCIPLDPTKHVKENPDGTKMIDLNGDDTENANTLQDQFNTQNAEKPEVSSVNNATAIAGAVIGGVIGFSLAAGLLYLGFRMITRKTAPQITS